MIILGRVLKLPGGGYIIVLKYVLLLPRKTYISAPLAVDLTIWLALASDACHFSIEVLTASTLLALCFFLFATTNPKCWQRLFPHFWAPNWSQDMEKTQLAEDIYCEQEINFIIWHYWKKKWGECVFVTKPILTGTFHCNMSLLHGTLMAPYFSQDKSQNFWSWHQALPLPPLITVFTITFMYPTVLPDFFPCSAPHTFLGKFWWKRSPGLRNLNYSGFWFCPLCYVLCEAISNHYSSKPISGLTTTVHDLY